MSTPNAGEVNSSMTGEETYSIDGNEVEDSSSAANSITLKEVARQIRAATDPLTKQSEKLCDLMLELR